MKSLYGVLIAMVVICAVGCNTVKGVGQDVESGGKGLQKIVEKND